MRVGIVGQGQVEDFHHGVAGPLVQCRAPELLKPGACLRVVHPLVVGEHHRDQPGIAGALHVVLAAQRVQAAAGLANLAGDGGQRNQAAHVVGAMHMLAHAHAPENHRGGTGGIGPRHFAQGAGGNAAQRGHGLGAVGLHMLAQGFVLEGAVADEGSVGQALFDHGVQQGVEQRHIGIGLELQGAPGVLAHVGGARVGQHQPGAALHRVFHPGGGHGVVGRGIGANDEDELGVLHVAHGVADGP